MQGTIMAAFLIASIGLKSLDWVSQYTLMVPPIVRSHGGRYLASSGGPPAVVETVEGTSIPPDGFAIITFPSIDAIKSFLADSRYEPFKQARRDGSTSDFWAFENDDDALQFRDQ
ncbi:DUF1330 domain-containing protein [Sphingomonas koreensis]|nr:DUF1330 domain-containing protein [Sphingomonas koreensis]